MNYLPNLKYTRYLSILLIVSFSASTLSADVIGYWRFDEADAIDGETITDVKSEANDEEFLETFVRRFENTENRWIFDFDHSNNHTRYGSIRIYIRTEGNPSTLRAANAPDYVPAFVDANDGSGVPEYVDRDPSKDGDGVNAFTRLLRMSASCFLTFMHIFSLSFSWPFYRCV